jgi:hypothetical protein
LANQVSRNHRKSLLGTDQRLNGRPCTLDALLFGYRLVFGQLLDLGVDLRLLLIGKLDACKATLLIDRDGRIIFDRAADVVDVDIVAENSGRVHIVLFDRCSRKADKRRVGEAVAEILGKAIGEFACTLLNLCLETILAPMSSSAMTTMFRLLDSTG